MDIHLFHPVIWFLSLLLLFARYGPKTIIDTLINSTEGYDYWASDIGPSIDDPGEVEVLYEQRHKFETEWQPRIKRVQLFLLACIVFFSVLGVIQGAFARPGQIAFFFSVFPFLLLMPIAMLRVVTVKDKETGRRTIRKFDFSASSIAWNMLKGFGFALAVLIGFILLNATILGALT